MIFREARLGHDIAKEIRDRALDKTYIDLHTDEGETYNRVVVADIPEWTKSLEELCGPILMLGMGFRLNYKGEFPNHAIHTDEGWGTHAGVLYLSTGGGGTAFWSSTGPNSVEINRCVEEFGKYCVYKSKQPHSRWPMDAYGDCPENGRLVAVCFFNIIEEM